MLKASIDIGSNSVLLLIAEFESGALVSVFNSQSRITSLGKGVEENGLLQKTPMAETIEAIDDYLILIKNARIDVKDVKVTATEASRKAINGKEFLRQLESKFCISIDLISGEKEAYLSSLAISKEFSLSEKFVMVDMGGASTEFALVSPNPFSVENSISVPLGSVRCTEWGIDFAEKINNLGLNYDWSKYCGYKVIGVGGSFTTITALAKNMKEFDESIVDAQILSKEDLLTLDEVIKNLSSDEIRRMYPFVGKRAEVMKAALKAALWQFETLKIAEMLISTRGIRFGVLY